MAQRPRHEQQRDIAKGLGGTLLLALALSLVFHLMVALFFGKYKATAHEEPLPVQHVTLTTLVHLHTPPPPTPPPPTPTPPSTPPPQTPPPKTPAPKTPPPLTPPPTIPPTTIPTQRPNHLTPAAKPSPAAHLHLNVPKTASKSAHAPDEAHADSAPGTQNGTLSGTGPTGTGEGGPPAGGGATPQPPAATPACSNPNREAAPIDKAPAETPEEAQGATGIAQVMLTLSPSGNVLDTSIYKSSGNPFLDKAAISAARQSTFRAARRNCVDVAGSYLFRVEFIN